MVSKSFLALGGVKFSGEERIPITYEQARECLKISPDKRTHSFYNNVCLSGADVDLSRAKEILKAAAKVKKLFLSDALAYVNHDIVAWDDKYEQWTYLECKPEKILQLKQVFEKQTISAIDRKATNYF